MTTIISVIVAGVETILTDSAPFWVESVEGAGMAPGHLIESRGPQQHGSTVEGYRLDPREVELLLGFETTGVSDPNRAVLLALFKRRAAANYLRFYLEDGRVRQINWHLAHGPVLGRAGTDHDVQRAAVVLRCPDPAFYDPEGIGVNFGLSGGGDAFEVPLAIPMEVGASALDQTTIVTYAGDVLEYPVIVLTGPIDDARIEHLTSGDVLDFDGLNLAGGESRTLDLRYGRKTVVDESGADAMADLTDDSDIATFALLPDPDAPGGNNAIRVTGTNVTTATAVNLQYFNRFAGV